MSFRSILMSNFSGQLGLASRRSIWLLYGIILLVAPMIFRGDMALTLLSAIGYLIIICLSYNILFGQGGMLSFGHAVYTGLGSFFAVHVMNMAATNIGLSIPIVLVPLVAGLGSALVAMLFGYVSTKKAGMVFAMITLGIGELVASMAQMFGGFFGGEGGISTNRTYGNSFLGFSFGPSLEVYYLIAAYCFLCTMAIYAFTRTPLGRMLNAVRDNPERVEFIGYNTHLVRYFSFVIAGFFAGIGGGLATINFEIVNAADSLSAARSGDYLLFTFVGGIGFFFGPIIGAVLLAFASVILPELTKAWLVYLGLAFLLMVMFAPGGLASLIASNLRVARYGKFRCLLLPYLKLLIAVALPLGSIAAIVEMAYHMKLNSAMGAVVRFVGINLDSSNALTWSGFVASLVVGLAIFEAARRSFYGLWEEIQREIEVEANLQEDLSASSSYE